MAKSPNPWPSRPSRPSASWSRHTAGQARRKAQARDGAALVMSAAAHLALLVFIGTHLTQAYVLPEQALHDIPPVEAILVPEPPPSVALPEPELRRLEPTLAPQGQLVTQPAPAPTPPIPAQAAPQKKKEDEDKALAAQPRLAAPNPTPLTFAPLNMAPVLRPPALPPVRRRASRRGPHQGVPMTISRSSRVVRSRAGCGAPCGLRLSAARTATRSP